MANRWNVDVKSGRGERDARPDLESYEHDNRRAPVRPRSDEKRDVTPPNSVGEAGSSLMFSASNIGRGK